MAGIQALHYGDEDAAQMKIERIGDKITITTWNDFGQVEISQEISIRELADGLGLLPGDIPNVDYRGS